MLNGELKSDRLPARLNVAQAAICIALCFGMTIDKQLQRIDINDVRRKRDADQALNIKEFAVLAGISYSVAREWFQTTGFPALHGKVFWQDFVLWRRSRNEKKNTPATPQVESGTGFGAIAAKPRPQHWPQRAAQILAETDASRMGA